MAEIKIGYALSSEEHPPNDLVRYARRAEEVGFSFAMISDHYHPWTRRQGNAAFVWSVLGAIAHATENLRVGTGVTCPLIRIHPAIIAQAAATTATLMPGRFILGLGTGEFLNEHVTGMPWPDAGTRLDMLVEAIEILRGLWEGKEFSYEGAYYTVRDATIFNLPDETIPVYIAASGDEAAALAGQLGDGLVSTGSGDPVESFRANGGIDKPTVGQVLGVWAESKDKARQILKEWWPTTALSGRLHVDLPTPKHYEDVVELLESTPESHAAIGPDPKSFVEQVHKKVESGYNHIYIHQVGPDQEGFFNFFERELAPMLESEGFYQPSNEAATQSA